MANSATARHLDTASFPTKLAGYTSVFAWLGGFGALDRMGLSPPGVGGRGLSRFLTGERLAEQIDGLLNPE